MAWSKSAPPVLDESHTCVACVCLGRIQGCCRPHSPPAAATLNCLSNTGTISRSCKRRQRSAQSKLPRTPSSNTSAEDVSLVCLGLTCSFRMASASQLPTRPAISQHGLFQSGNGRRRRIYREGRPVACGSSHASRAPARGLNLIPRIVRRYCAAHRNVTRGAKREKFCASLWTGAL
jgi:hypothetical protein